MIASLKGVVQLTGVDHAVIDVNGVGYLVQASSRTLSNLEPGTAAFLLVETHVREDAIVLFGFAHAPERDWFRLLTSVQGVGGKVALAILGTLSADELSRAITLEDKAMIARAQGVGPRLAARIATELKGKAAPGPGSDLAATAAIQSAKPATPEADAVSALENLGFRTPEAARAVAEAIRDLGELPTPTLIREALKRATR